MIKEVHDKETHQINKYQQMIWYQNQQNKEKRQFTQRKYQCPKQRKKSNERKEEIRVDRTQEEINNRRKYQTLGEGPNNIYINTPERGYFNNNNTMDTIIIWERSY